MVSDSSGLGSMFPLWSMMVMRGPEGNMAQQVSYMRAMVMNTGSSFLVPVIGLATAPLLAQALGVVGRGQSAAALAPNLLIVGGATLGLPQAVTFFLAKRPHLTRVALGQASLLSVMLGILTVAGVWLSRDYLSDGDPDLGRLMLLGAWLAPPALVVAVLRGAAAGRQMWSAVALERIFNSSLRLALFGVLAIMGRLDVLNAFLIMAIAPIVAGIAYVKLLARPPEAGPDDADDTPVTSSLLGYGMRVWLGSVAIMIMARSSQLLITPLSNVEQLGLFVVAVTIADVPYIVTQTVRDVAFSASSAESDVDRLMTTSRVVTLVAFAGAAAMAVSLPFWIGPVFGSGFEGAVVTTWLMLAGSCLAVPGLVAGAGVDSAGRPGLRSASLALALVVNLAALPLLVPGMGAVGAALGGLLTTLFSTAFIVVAAARVLGVPATAFFVPRRSDLAALARLVTTIVRRVTHRGGRPVAPTARDRSG